MKVLNERVIYNFIIKLILTILFHYSKFLFVMDIN